MSQPPRPVGLEPAAASGGNRQYRLSTCPPRHPYQMNTQLVPAASINSPPPAINQFTALKCIICAQHPTRSSPLTICKRYFTMERRMHLKQEGNMECDSPHMTDWKDCICRAIALAMLRHFCHRDGQRSGAGCVRRQLCDLRHVPANRRGQRRNAHRMARARPEWRPRPAAQPIQP